MLRISDPDQLRALPHQSFALPALQGLLMVRPDGFRLSPQAASDNRYMRATDADAAIALEEHARVVTALEAAGLRVEVLPGDPQWPDACFPNNAVATLPGGTVIYGRLRHPDRQGEPNRPVLRQRMADLGYHQIIDWSEPREAVCELTGSLVIDHRQRIGYLGRSDRMNAAGADLVAAHWDLEVLVEFDLAPGEYHTNVVLAILAGCACVMAPAGFADHTMAAAIAARYAPQVLTLTPEQQAAFAGNILSLGDALVAMSMTAADALGAAGLGALASWGFQPLVAPIPELEKGGGSMRCLLCELW